MDRDSDYSELGVYFCYEAKCKNISAANHSAGALRHLYVCHTDACLSVVSAIPECGHDWHHQCTNSGNGGQSFTTLAGRRTRKTNRKIMWPSASVHK